MDALPDGSESYVRQPVRAARAVKPWVPQLARLGYGAIGVVYLVIGLLAVLQAVGVGGQVVGTGGAVRTVIDQPYGRILLGVVALGMLVFVAWRGAQALLDAEARGQTRGALARRTGLALSGLSYAGLAVVAAQRALHGGYVEDPKSDWVAQLMSYPAGAVVVGAVGVALLGVAAYQFYAATTAGFVQYLRDADLPPSAEHTVTGLGRYGLGARGVVFGILGVLIVRAAWRTDASDPPGLSEALHTLSSQPYGRILLGLVALGLALFGVFVLTKTWYRHLDLEERASDDEDGERSGSETDQQESA